MKINKKKNISEKNKKKVKINKKIKKNQNK